MLFETLIIFSATTISAIINCIIFDCLYEELDVIQNKEIKILLESHNNLKKNNFLLEKKDDMTPEQIDEQIEKSDARYEIRLQELVANLNKNPLENALPPIFCTIDPKTGLVKKGIMQHDHPTFDTMMDDVLDVCFNGIGTAFNSELATYFPSMETLGSGTCPR